MEYNKNNVSTAPYKYNLHNTADLWSGGTRVELQDTLDFSCPPIRGIGDTRLEL